MKINFVIPFTGKTGGIKIVLEYANRLKEKGHDVVIYTPMISYKFNNYGFTGVINRLKATLGNIIKRGTKIKWFNLDATLKLVPVISNIYIRDADVVIATAWPTAYDVNKLSLSKGTKFYFVQHYEIWSGRKEDVDNTFRLPLKKIVIAEWLKKLVEEKTNEKDIEILYNGIDFEEFYNEDKKFKNNVVSIMYHDLDWKGYKIGLEAFEMVKQKLPDLKLIIFGLSKGDSIPDYAEFYLRPNKEQLREIYCKSDVFIFPSKFEGWGLTPLEAMACKCAVVGTNVGSIKEIGKNYVNAMICEPEDVNKLAENLYKILTDSESLKNISLNGYKTVLEFSWDKSTNKLEAILNEK